VIQAVRFAREHELLVAVRGGGHNIAGNAVCDGGLMIDLSPMKSVRVDPAARTARVEPGVTLGEFDHEAQVFGLATPLGINSTTGVAGLTLGGGFGWLSRRLGLSIDNLLTADVVTAAGDMERASGTDNPDLFWAIRGGGGNFGVVTSFEFRLHNVGPEVLSGLIIHPLDAAREVLHFYRDFLTTTPEEFVCWFVLRKAPPVPFVPVEWHGKEILALAVCYSGSVEEGERVATPLRAFRKPLADLVAPHPYAAWQTVLDPLLAPGMRNYWKSHDFRELSDGLIDVLVDYAHRIPDPQTEIAFAQLGGAVS
jgi:FAD/FMN-containing dehydrogenase